LLAVNEKFYSLLASVSDELFWKNFDACNVIATHVGDIF
jgi:hypothetical protein